MTLLRPSKLPCLLPAASPTAFSGILEPQEMRVQCISSGDLHSTCRVAPDGNGGPGAGPCCEKGPDTCWPEVRPSSPIQGNWVLCADGGGHGLASGDLRVERGWRENLL